MLRNAISFYLHFKSYAESFDICISILRYPFNVVGVFIFIKYFSLINLLQPLRSPNKQSYATEKVCAYCHTLTSPPSMSALFALMHKSRTSNFIIMFANHMQSLVNTCNNVVINPHTIKPVFAFLLPL